jgi:uncharacterized protein (DUF2267 family)
MANDGGRRPAVEERRQRRHDSRAGQTWADFLRELHQHADPRLDDRTLARAASSVLRHLAERLTESEAHDLAAQLPSRLRDLIAESLRQPHELHKLHRNEFVACVGDDLGCDAPEAEALIRGVFDTVRSWISEGESEHVAAQLPRDLRPLWHPVS